MKDNTLNSLIDYIFDHWDYFEVGVGKPRFLQPRMLTRTSSISKITYKGIGLFIDQQKLPLFYVKPILKNSKERYVNEHENLSYLEKYVKNTLLRESIPAKSLIFEVDEFLFFISKYIFGYTLDFILDEEEKFENSLEYGSICLSWLSLLQRENVKRIKFSSKNVEKELVLLRDSFGVIADHLPGPIEQLLSDIKQFDGLDVPCGYSHGDFAPENVIFNDSKIQAVIDWEDFSNSRLPMVDFLRFIIVFTVNRKKFLKLNPDYTDRYVEWLIKEQTEFLGRTKLKQDFFEAYARPALVESVNILLKRDKMRQMAGRAMLAVALHGVPVFYRNMTLVECIKDFVYSA